MNVQIHTCAECPCCEESGTEGDFYCKHDRKPEEESRDALGIFDAIPDWCPIREEPLIVEVHP